MQFRLFSEFINTCREGLPAVGGGGSGAFQARHGKCGMQVVTATYPAPPPPRHCIPSRRSNPPPPTLCSMRLHGEG